MWILGLKGLNSINWRLYFYSFSLWGVLHISESRDILFTHYLNAGPAPPAEIVHPFQDMTLNFGHFTLGAPHEKI